MALQALKTGERKVDVKVVETMQQLSNKKDNDENSFPGTGASAGQGTLEGEDGDGSGEAGDKLGGAAARL